MCDDNCLKKGENTRNSLTMNGFKLEEAHFPLVVLCLLGRKISLIVAQLVTEKHANCQSTKEKEACKRVTASRVARASWQAYKLKWTCEENVQSQAKPFAGRTERLAAATTPGCGQNSTELSDKRAQCDPHTD